LAFQGRKNWTLRLKIQLFVHSRSLLLTMLSPACLVTVDISSRNLVAVDIAARRVVLVDEVAYFQVDRHAMMDEGMHACSSVSGDSVAVNGSPLATGFVLQALVANQALGDAFEVA
jgi:hypothetical protein